MVTQEGNSPIWGMVGKPTSERDMHMVEAGEANSTAGTISGKTTHVSFIAASKEWKHNNNGNRLTSEASETVSTPADWSSRIESTVRQQVGEVMQVQQTINSMARLLEAPVACEKMQSLTANEWLEEQDVMWDRWQKHNVLWLTGIIDMTAEVLGNAQVCEAAPALEARKEERDETASQEGGGLEASQHARPMQHGEPEKCQLQQQPKPKHKVRLKHHHKQQSEPKPKPTPTSARRW